MIRNQYTVEPTSAYFEVVAPAQYRRDVTLDALASRQGSGRDVERAVRCIRPVALAGGASVTAQGCGGLLEVRPHLGVPEL